MNKDNWKIEIREPEEWSYLGGLYKHTSGRNIVITAHGSSPSLVEAIQTLKSNTPAVTNVLKSANPSIQLPASEQVPQKSWWSC